MSVAVAAGELVDDGLERFARDVLHHEVVVAVLFDADVVDGNDVRVLEAADGAHPFGEARNDAGRPHPGVQATARPARSAGTGALRRDALLRCGRCASTSGMAAEPTPPS